MPNISELIKEAEDKWLSELFSYVTELFKPIFLPSHNQWHHLRTWQNAKIILRHIANDGYAFSYTTVEAALIASLFHDTGLTVTLDEKHGKAGAAICDHYFKERKLNMQAIENILLAIEYHENKESQVYECSPEKLRTIISAADDMDAFGIIGIYRYAEIYLMRGVLLDILGTKVLTNLENRFKKIEENYFRFPVLMKGIAESYNQTQQFYQRLSMQRLEELAMMNFIKNEVVNKKQELSTEMIEKISEEVVNKVGLEFLHNLCKSLTTVV